MALLEGKHLIDHAAAQLADYVDKIVIIGGNDGLPDLPSPNLGPLGGIAGALAHARQSGIDSVLTIACDMPRVPVGVIATLLEHRAAWCSDAPVLGHWPSSHAVALQKYLFAGEPRAVRHWARSIDATPVAVGDSIANINTLADLMAL